MPVQHVHHGCVPATRHRLAIAAVGPRCLKFRCIAPGHAARRGVRAALQRAVVDAELYEGPPAIARGGVVRRAPSVSRDGHADVYQTIIAAAAITRLVS
eukprot:SAG31_NODE_3483_length_4215_cov_2.188533_3_plen_99_part_00